MNSGYFPPESGLPWACVPPSDAGFDADRLAEAVNFACAHETPWPIDLRSWMEAGCFEPPPFNEILGPVQPRGKPNGIVLRHGFIVARWGDTSRVDMAFSVAKSMLSLLAGIAVAENLIGSLDEPVGRTVDDGGFEGAHNGLITWRQLLQQTSEWEGVLWGKPDVIDRYRDVGDNAAHSKKGQARPLQGPGSYWEYNDVRVNRFSLALLRRFGCALPKVFRELIMRPIGASTDWRWEGYANSIVDIGGRRVVCVPGGGHWGGGLFIHSEDLARVSLLLSRRGRWGMRELIPETWIAESLEPCRLNPSYGLYWWLNTGRRKYPAASEKSYFATGAGGNLCWVDPEKDIVAVLRWIDPDAINCFIARVDTATR